MIMDREQMCDVYMHECEVLRRRVHELEAELHRIQPMDANTRTVPLAGGMWCVEDVDKHAK
jgi:hypothetical protein